MDLSKHPVKWLSRASIVIPPRQRSELNPKKLSDLVKSIETVGLLHPVIVRPNGKTYLLVTGERRMRAIEALRKDYSFGPHLVPWDQIPALVVGENISEYEAALIELEENLRREDLSWQDEARALVKLVELKGGPTAAGEVVAEAQGIAPITARAKIAKAIRVVKNLEDPEIANSPSLRQAEAKVRAREVEATKDPGFDLIQGDVLQHIFDEPDGKYSVIFLDPPYGMGADKWRGMTLHPYEDSKTNTVDLLRKISPELFRVAAPGAHLWCFCDIDLFIFLRHLFTEAGFKVMRTPLIWHKVTVQGSTPLVDIRIRRSYELILFGMKAPYRDVNKLTNDVLSVEHTFFSPHGAAKPVEIYEALLDLSGTQTSYVLDPFAGTAPSLEACRRRKIPARGYEISQEVCQLAKARWSLPLDEKRTPQIIREGRELLEELFEKEEKDEPSG